METPVSTIVSTGDLGGRKVAMGIDVNAMAHIMSILTDLYSDPELAVIREYSTNARDAHIEAGQTRPIEVTTPSGLSPHFKVKDYGVGLSVDDIERIYSQYGASTKRGTNEQVGMLGLGCKSALTLVPQFNITSVKNGVRILVSVSRDATGAGHMEIIDTKACDEPNGVEISIPVPRGGNFAQKCKDFFRFWEPGTVLVDGKEPALLDGRKVSDKFTINRDLRTDYVVMGNVAYPVKDGLGNLATNGYYYHPLGIVARVDIGDVNFTPSREQLHYTPKTKETIERLRVEFRDSLTASAQASVREAANFTEAWKMAYEWRKDFRNLGELKYKGLAVPQDVAFQKPWKDVDIFAARATRGSMWSHALNPTMTEKYILIDGFNDSLKMSAVQRQRVIKYMEQAGLKATRALVTNLPHNFPKNDWTKDFHVVDWSIIGKIKVDRAAVTVGMPRKTHNETYELYTGKYNYTPTSDLDDTKDIIFISTAENKRPSFLRDAYPDAQIVMLSQNRWDKFKRDWPTALHYQAKINADRKTLLKKLTLEDRILMHHNDKKWDVMDLDPARIDDPELKKFVEVLTKGEYSDAAKTWRALPGSHTYEVETPDNPLTNYPLAGSIRRAGAEHVIWYLNAHYRDNLKENG